MIEPTLCRGGAAHPPTPAAPPRHLVLLAAAGLFLGSAVMGRADSVSVGAESLDLFQSHCVGPLTTADIPHAQGLAPLEPDHAERFQRILGLMGVANTDPEGQEFWVTDTTKLIYVTRRDQPYCVVFGFDAEYIEVSAALADWRDMHGDAFLADGDFSLDSTVAGRPALTSLTRNLPENGTIRLSLSYDPKLAGLFVAAADRVDTR